MVLGVRRWELHLEGCHSLKEKRSVIKPIVNGLRKTFNVSVAETGHHDLWQRAELACAALGTDRRVVEEILRSADRMMDESDGVRIIDTLTEYR